MRYVHVLGRGGATFQKIETNKPFGPKETMLCAPSLARSTTGILIFFRILETESTCKIHN
jgi:hypothetical protein